MLGTALLLLLAAAPHPHAPHGAAHGQAADSPHFDYDVPEHALAAESVAGPDDYEPTLAVRTTASGAPEVVRAWLRYVPGAGDALWLQRAGAEPREIVPPSGALARPTLTAIGARTWLSVERRASAAPGPVAAPEAWEVCATLLDFTGEAACPALERWCVAGASAAPAGYRSAIAHAAAGLPDGSLRIAAQRTTGSDFEIAVATVRGDLGGELASDAWTRVSGAHRGAYAPDIDVAPSGATCVVWDAWNGRSFDVFARWQLDGAWGSPLVVADAPAFEARPQVACAPAERDAPASAWIAWEQGGDGWGEAYTGNDGVWNNVSSGRGPLHRLRTTHLARLDANGDGSYARPLPRDQAQTRRAAWTNLRPDADWIGCYYERPELVVDGSGRPWVLYRHYDAPQLASLDPAKHHVENGWRIYARAYQPSGRWSELVGFDLGQRDGAQRLAVAPLQRGWTAIWSTGRTDRRPDERPRGLAAGSFELPVTAPSAAERQDVAKAEADPAHAQPTRLRTAPSAAAAPAPRPRLEVRAGGVTYRAFHGDLHRHTDLSLCFPFYDGSLDDAYRYALGPGELDFLAVTDHTRDIDRGNVQALLWWRSTKAVTRHTVPGRFVALFGYERSHGQTDHNVISLRDDMLRNFPPPLTEFWAEIDDGQTITIPHTTHNVPGVPYNGTVWDEQDDAKRPLVEVYQGFRGVSALAEAQVPLRKGYKLGFIASSDHLSTSASYAGAFAERLTREAIFTALAERRTFGSTGRGATLLLRAGEALMGAAIRWDDAASSDGSLLLSVQVAGDPVPRSASAGRAEPASQDPERGAAEPPGAGPSPSQADRTERPAAAPRGPGNPDRIELWLDGRPWKGLPAGPAASPGTASQLRLPPGALGQGEHYLFVRAFFGDGTRAWSSPLWVQVP